MTATISGGKFYTGPSGRLIFIEFSAIPAHCRPTYDRLTKNYYTGTIDDANMGLIANEYDAFVESGCDAYIETWYQAIANGRTI